MKEETALDSAQILYGPPLPPRAAEPAPRRLWGDGYIVPEGIGDRDYVVVEEVFDDNVGIVVAPWPEIDESGGLAFGDEEERHEAVVDRPSLQRRLADREVVAYEVGPTDPAMRTRPVTAGDVFAVETSFPEGDRDSRELGADWIQGTVVDITAMARDAAKAAMLAALTGTPLSPEEAVSIAEGLAETEPPPPAEPPPVGPVA